jgi:hypothetical protein
MPARLATAASSSAGWTGFEMRLVAGPERPHAIFRTRIRRHRDRGHRGRAVGSARHRINRTRPAPASDVADQQVRRPALNRCSACSTEDAASTAAPRS